MVLVSLFPLWIPPFFGMALQPGLEGFLVAFHGVVIRVEHAGLASPLAAFLQCRLPRGQRTGVIGLRPRWGLRVHRLAACRILAPVIVWAVLHKEFVGPKSGKLLVNGLPAA